MRRLVWLAVVLGVGCLPDPLPEDLTLLAESPVSGLPGQRVSFGVSTRCASRCELAQGWQPRLMVRPRGCCGTAPLEPAPPSWAVDFSMDDRAVSWAADLTIPADAAPGPWDEFVVVLATSDGRVGSSIAPLVVNVGDPRFTLSAVPAAVSVVAGEAVSVSVVVERAEPLGSPIALTVDADPALEVTLDAAQTSGEPVRMLVRAPPGLASRDYPVTIFGRSPEGRARLDFMTVVVPAGGPGFTVRSEPPALVVPRGGSTSARAVVSRLRGFGGTVALSFEGLPAGVTAAFSPPSLALGVDGGDFTLSAAVAAAPVIAPIVLRASSGSQVAEYDVLLTVPGEVFDGGVPPFDAGVEDAGSPVDAGAPDAGPPDAGPPDAGAPDAGEPDAGAPDAGAPDAGEPDAGAPDAGEPDAGIDAGVDAGAVDAGWGIILTFTASATTINEGETVTLAWTTDNADDCSVYPSLFSVLPANGNLSLSPTTTTSYRLECRRGGLWEDRWLEVTVIPIPRPVVIDAFDPSSLLLSLRDSYPLSWTVSYATSCTLSPDAGAVTLPTGSIEVTPLVDTTWTLTCQGYMGPVTATASISVLANQPPDGTILAPDAGAELEPGDVITLVGQCTDDAAGGPISWTDWRWVGQYSVGGTPATVGLYDEFATLGPRTFDFTCYDALNKPDPTPPAVTVQVVAPVPVSAGYGQNHSCSRSAGGRVYCVGDNQQGQLALPNNVVQRWTSQQVRAGDRRWSVLDVDPVGGACGITTDGALWCWGNGVRTPAQPDTTLGWTHVTGSGSHRCAIQAGWLYCWGSNTAGQIGLGVSGGFQNAPARVGLATDWSAVSAGGATTCGLRGTKLYCWASNTSGALGTGGSINLSTPAAIAASLDFSLVSVGAGNSACAVTTTGALYCWGNDADGQLGDGTVGGSTLVPTRLGLDSDWLDVSVGSTHACARKALGELWCWGSDTWGQLGNGTGGASATPVRVGALDGWDSVDVGALGSCAVRDGVAWCWGRNHFGQLGIGSANAGANEVPVEVRYVP